MSIAHFLSEKTGFFLLKNRPSFLAMATVIMFFSSIGQTFVLSQFSPFFMKELELSRSQISFVYSLATLLASFNLTFFGSLIDRFPVRRPGPIVVILIAVGLCFLSQANGVITLFIGYYLTRGFGQMVLSMLASTKISKMYGRYRSKALMVGGFGRNIADGSLPLILVYLVSNLGERSAFLVMASVLVVVLVPLLIWGPLNREIVLFNENDDVKNLQSNYRLEKDWKWWQLLKEPKVFFLMLTNAIIPFVVTGLFFQWDAIASSEGWDQKLMAKGFTFYSLSLVLGLFFWSNLVEKFTARRLLPFVLIPLIFGLIGLILFQGVWVCFYYMALVGLSLGLGGVVRANFYAEVFGTESLGKIKGLDGNFLVLGTAFAPFVYAWVLDHGLNAQDLLKYLLIICLLSLVSYCLLARAWKTQ